MIVGTGAVCPQCHKNDATQQVNLVVQMVEGALSPAAYENLELKYKSGQGSDWATPAGEESWSALARKFSMPSRPRLSIFGSYNLFLYPLAVLYIFFIVYMFMTATVMNMTVTVMRGLLCVVTVGMFLLGTVAVFVGRRKKREFDGQLQVWNEQKERYDKLYYCARDNKIFLPGSTECVSPKEMKQLISANNSRV